MSEEKGSQPCSDFLKTFLEESFLVLNIIIK